MKEQDFNQWLREKSDSTPIPEALSPEHIEEQLKNSSQHKKWYQHPWLNAAAGFLLLGIITSAVWVINTGTRKMENSSDIQQADSAMENAVEEEAYTETTKNLTNIQSPASYQELYNLICQIDEEIKYATDDELIQGSAENAMDLDSTTTNGSSSNNNRSEQDYYDTNSQVDQVAEADIVKTDGVYIYSCYQQRDYITNAVAIAKADNGKLSACSVISAEQIASDISCDDFIIQEMYILNNKLILLCDGRQPSQQALANSADEDIIGEMASIACGVSYYNATYILTYDVSNPDQPKLLASLVQDGSYNTSRLTNGYLYTFSEKYAYHPVDYEEYNMYVPHIDEQPLRCEDIFLPECPESSSYQVMTGISIAQPDQFISSKAVLSGGGTYYVSSENIYFAQYSWFSKGTPQTEILKFHYSEGSIQPEGSVKIDGYLLNQFSMDEYEGYLRIAVTIPPTYNNIIYGKAVDDVATTSESNLQTNALYIMNSDMDIVGYIDNLAPDERIYSVRFMGETGYFVTYRETDPLFSVDLSDPEHPQIMDALKIPGFSNYLHFYSDDLLFGLGEEIDPSTGMFVGAKLSMFDISDPYNITELDKTVIPDVYYSTAQYNHKSLMIDPERNLIGFYTECYNNRNYEYKEAYVIYSYTLEEGFQEEFTCILSDDLIFSQGATEYGMNFYNIRGLYIDDYFYLVDGNRFSSYSLDTYEHIEGLLVKEDGKHIHVEG